MMKFALIVNLASAAADLHLDANSSSPSACLPNGKCMTGGNADCCSGCSHQAWPICGPMGVNPLRCGPCGDSEDAVPEALPAAIPEAIPEASFEAFQEKVVSAGRPIELEGANTAKEILDIVSKSETLMAQLPVQLSGPNMTLANFEKYFDITVSYHGPALKSVAPSEAALLQMQELRQRFQARSNLSDTNDPTDVVNAAENSWDFVKNNQAVVDLVSLGHFATATPPGVAWNNVVFNGESDCNQVQVSWKNGFGDESAQIYYRLYWLYHGKYGNDGKQYMAQITQVVDYAHAIWAVNIGARSETSPPALVSRSGQTVSQIVMNLDMWSNGNHQPVSYIVRGDGSLENLADLGSPQAAAVMV